MKIDNNFVEDLIAQWTTFIDPQTDPSNFNTSLFNDLLRSTSRVVLSTKWTTTTAKRISPKNKDDLVGILKDFKEKWTRSQGQFGHYTNPIDRLVFLSNDPWPDEIHEVKKMENYNNINIKQAQHFWKLEGPIILQTRIEYMLILRGRGYNSALSLLKLILLMWKGACCSTNVFSDLPDRVQHNSELCPLSSWDCSLYENDYFFKYLDLFIVMIILEDKFDELDEFLTTETMIDSALRIVIKPTEDVISWKGWKELKNIRVGVRREGWEHLEKIRSGLTTMLMRSTWKILKGNMSASIDELQCFYHLIYFLDEPDGVPRRLSKLNTEIFSKLHEIANIEHIYALVQYIFEKNVDAKYNADRNELFLELFTSVLHEEYNRIIAMEHETSKDIIKEMEIHLSSKYCLVSDYLLPYPRTSWEFLLTAFSLNPTQDLYNQLFVDGVNVQHIMTNLPSELDLSSELEKTKLPSTLIEQLTGVITLGRIRASQLQRYPSLEVLIERCQEHMELKGLQSRKRREELKNLFVDFTNYTGEEEVDDDQTETINGYEKGYRPNAKIFQKVKKVRGPYKKRPKTDIENGGDGGLNLKRKVRFTKKRGPYKKRPKTDFENDGDCGGLKRKVRLSKKRGPYKKKLKTDLEIDGDVGLKRKVGRPKKYLYLNESASEKKFKFVRTVIDSQGRVIQRGRGRPKNADMIKDYRVVKRKVYVDSDKEAISVQSSSQNGNEKSKSGQILKKEKKVKRGPGRPRKILIENENNISSSSSSSVGTEAGENIIGEKSDQRHFPDAIFQSSSEDSSNSNTSSNIDSDTLTLSNFLKSKPSEDSNTSTNSDSETSTSSNSFMENEPSASSSTSTRISTLSTSTTTLSDSFFNTTFSLKPVSILLKRIDFNAYANNKDLLPELPADLDVELPEPDPDENDGYDSDSSSSSSSISAHSDITTYVDSDDDLSQDQVLNENENTADDNDEFGDSDSDSDDMSLDSDCQVVYERPPPDFENSSLESSMKGSCSSVTTTTATIQSVPEKKMFKPLPSNQVVLNLNLNNNVTTTANRICQKNRLQLLINSLNLESDNSNSSLNSNYMSYADSSSESDDDEEDPEISIVNICRPFKQV